MVIFAGEFFLQVVLPPLTHEIGEVPYPTAWTVYTGECLVAPNVGASRTTAAPTVPLVYFYFMHDQIILFIPFIVFCIHVCDISLYSHIKRQL